MPYDRPFCSQVGSELNKLRPKPYESWAAYVKDAERAGLVVTGLGEKAGQEWIAIKVR